MDKVIYLTLVTLVCYVNGQRTEIPPGKPVPDSLKEHEINELLASGSIERSDAAQIEKRQQQLAGGQTQADFEQEKKRLQAARESNEQAAAEAGKGADPDSKNAGAKKK
jgi:hypothetical protein